MQKFFKHIMIFLIPVLIVWGSLEYFYRTVESNYSFKHRAVMENYDQIETLVLGDSHAFFGINPEYMGSKTFNLSNISQSLYFDELLFKKHFDSLKHLKRVIVTIGYYSLSQQDNVKEDIWRKYFYRSQMDMDVPIVSDFNVKKYSLALTRRFSKSLDLVNNYLANGSIVSCDSNGWGNYYKNSSAVPLMDGVKTAAKRHEDHLMDFKQNLARLRYIIEKCKQRNCKVYLVDMPVYEGYLDALNPVKLEKITNSCKKLEQSYPNVMYMDLREDHRLEDTDFYDVDHLNHKGAKKFTKIMNMLISTDK